MKNNPKVLEPKMKRTFGHLYLDSADLFHHSHRINYDEEKYEWIEKLKLEIDEHLKGVLMNKFIGIGRLTKDPDLRYTKSNQPVATFTLAIDRQMSKDKRDEAEANGWPTADFPRVTVWGNMAVNCEKYLKKGSQCAVVGRLQTGSYQDKDGKTVYTTEILAENVEFLSRANGSSNASKTSGGTVDDEFFGDDFTEIEDDGRIPF